MSPLDSLTPKKVYVVVIAMPNHVWPVANSGPVLLFLAKTPKTRLIAPAKFQKIT